jgi:hypothetical protein
LASRCLGVERSLSSTMTDWSQAPRKYVARRFLQK